jgi:hypothetical protein
VSLQHLERFATLDRDSLPESRKARPAD